MDAATLLALSILRQLCLDTASCETCPMRDYCGKLPSEWEV